VSTPGRLPLQCPHASAGLPSARPRDGDSLQASIRLKDVSSCTEWMSQHCRIYRGKLHFSGPKVSTRAPSGCGCLECEAFLEPNPPYGHGGLCLAIVAPARRTFIRAELPIFSRRICLTAADPILALFRENRWDCASRCYVDPWDSWPGQLCDPPKANNPNDCGGLGVRDRIYSSANGSLSTTVSHFSDY
jgi:hypothetical protein